MLDEAIFNNFIRKANQSYNQFCIWMFSNNEFAKYQKGWNEIPYDGDKLFNIKDFSQERGCKYKNFWDVIIPTLQHSWILSLSRLFDPPYFFRDKNKDKPRLSIYYIIEQLENDNLEKSIIRQLNKYKDFIDSIKKQRDNFLAHNDIKFTDRKIEAGVENIFETLDNIVAEIKKAKIHLRNCDTINREYTEKLCKCGVEEVFEALLK